MKREKTRPYIWLCKSYTKKTNRLLSVQNHRNHAPDNGTAQQSGKIAEMIMKFKNNWNRNDCYYE